MCFFQMAALVLRPGKAKREGALGKLRVDIGRAELAVLDEFDVSSYRL